MREVKLQDHFRPHSYNLRQSSDGIYTVKIVGQRIGRPSKRLTLHQKGVRVKTAQINSTHKSKAVTHDVERINHLPTFQQVRLHTSQLQYPGTYTIVLEFIGPKLANHNDINTSDLLNTALRQYFPSIDEDAAKREIILEIN